MGRKKNLKGQTFGRLTVLYEAEPQYTSGGNRKVMWHCKCDCGNEKDIPSGDLLSGHTKSCGCYNLEIAAKRMSKIRKTYNTYDLSGDFGIGFTSKGDEFWFDKEDYDLIKEYCWFKHHDYFVAKELNSGTYKTIQLHNLITGNHTPGYVSDHIKSEYKFDNRKCNLRVVTRSDNNKNRKLASNNKSGVTGVYWRKREGMWSAQIRVNYKRIDLGNFIRFEDAVAARKQAEEKYFGELSYDNSQKRYMEESTYGNV